MISITNWRHLFPFGEPRQQQVDVINFTLNAFINDQKRFVILNCPTGIGKSAIAITVARYLDQAEHGDAYVLTTQKLLQEQYVRDFGIKNLKSSSNYRCLHYPEQSCGESRRLLEKLSKQLVGTDFHTCCKSRCPYVAAKREFLASSLGVTNFAYFLAETMYAGSLQPRHLLVVDECHTLERQISSHVEVSFSEKFARDILHCKKFPQKNDQESVFKWISDVYRCVLVKHVKTFEKTIERNIKLEKSLGQNMSSGVNVGITQLSKRYEMLDKHMCKVNRFVEAYDSENWVMNNSVIDVHGKQHRKFEFKPVDVSSLGEKYLFKSGERVLLMSATIVDKDVFCRSVGISPQQAAYTCVNSPFSIASRKIYYMPVGSMSAKCIDVTLPSMSKAVETILQEHALDRGVVHCVNFRIAKYLKDSIHSDRLLLHDSTNREKVLQQHLSSNEPTVLLSPSMMEGVDLSDDNSRFQVLCKVPFPYLGDKVVQKRMKKDKLWYDCATTQMIIQSLGRSIRSVDDYAVSYILDADWELFYKRALHMFPDDFSLLLK